MRPKKPLVKTNESTQGGLRVGDSRAGLNVTVETSEITLIYPRGVWAICPLSNFLEDGCSPIVLLLRNAGLGTFRKMYDEIKTWNH